MSEVSKTFDELTGVATYITPPRPLFEQKSGLFTSKPGASISINLVTLTGTNGTQIYLQFREIQTRIDLPATETLFFLIGDERFQFDCTFSRMAGSDSVVLDIETAEVTLNFLEKLAECAGAKSRIRSIDVEIGFPFLADVEDMLAALQSP